jgi:lipopolysaccharide export system permease protein
MGILARYFCKEFFKLLALCQAIFVFLYLIIDFLQKIDNFVEAEASAGAMLAFLFYKVPLIAVQMAPVAALISVVVMFSFMKKNNEMTALKACGISVFRLSLPVLFASIGLSIAVFLFSELAVPYASSKSNDIWDRNVSKRDQGRFYGRNRIWYKGTNSIYWIRHFDGKRMVMEDPAFYFFDDSFHLIKRIDAQKAIWVGDRWRVQEGIIQKMGDEGVYNLSRFKEIDLRLKETPESFLRTVKLPEEMSYWELKRYAEKIAIEGYDDTRFLVDMNVKLAFPLLSFVMVLVGIPITLGLKRRGAPLAVSLGIAACFLYYLIFGLAQSLGYSGVLPPVLSAWLASLAFLFFGSYLMMRLQT